MVGKTLGHYEILAKVGEGGMGEVYRAKDTRLGRTVAIKVLPGDLVSRQDLRQRFEREARTISSLNHPHICTLYDIGEHEGVNFLVMEFLDGQTLEKRLSKGPLAADEALRLSIEIADALNRAHHQGIIHRDLKPGNIMLTKSGAKLLDFGLAKFKAEPVPTAAVLTEMATDARKLTAEGMILGTLLYMAPEQLEGKESDARTDIFALGAVMFEMITGRPAFTGKSKASLIAAILASDPPPISQIQPMTPPALDRVVKRCLAKDPDERWQTARDLGAELKWIAEAGAAAGLPRQEAPGGIKPPLLWIAWAAVATFVALALAVVVASTFLRQENKSPIRFPVLPPENASLPRIPSMSVSPDGRRLAFPAHTADGKDLLFVRSLDNLTAQPLPGTDDGQFPFWSPDSRYLGFFADQKLKKIDVTGGAPAVLCDAPFGMGGAWNREGVIVFTPKGGSPLYRVSDSGGVPTPVTTVDHSRNEFENDWPQFLPDGRRFLYFAYGFRVQDRWICAGSLDSKETKYLVNVNSNGMYAPPGYLLFVRGGTLVAQPFDAKRLRFTGETFPVAERVGLYAFVGYGYFSVSESGVLVYQNESAQNTELRWFDRSGTKRGTVGQPGDYTNPALSPDGSKVAVGVRDAQTKTRDIWVFDLKRGTASRLTFDPAEDLNPAWSSDGNRILFTSERKGYRDIYEKAANGIGEEQLIYQSNENKSVTDWSWDRKHVVYDDDSRTGVWVLPLSGDRKPFPYVQANYDAQQGQLSANGRFIAYSSDETGRLEVYVQTFPERRGKWQISTAGASGPQWRHDGKELFYLAEGKIMAVEVKTDSSQFEAGIPKVLFDAHIQAAGFRNQYVVSPDGQRFLVVAPVEKAASTAMTVVVNWTARLGNK